MNQPDSFASIQICKDTYGQESLDMIFRLKMIEKILLEEDFRPHLFIQVVKNFLSSVSTRDPNGFHYDIARIALSKSKKIDPTNNEIDMLARSLLDNCKTLESKIKYPDVINELKKMEPQDLEGAKELSYYLEFIDCPEATDQFEDSFFAKNGLSVWDNAYLDLLSSIGLEGKKQAAHLRNKLKDAEGKWDPKFWFILKSNNEKHFYHSPALIYMGYVLWKDVIEKQLYRKEKGYPSLTEKTVINGIIPILAPKKTKSFVKENQSIICVQEGKPIVFAPALDQSMILAFQQGVHELSSIIGHRIIRWQVKRAYEQWANGKNDARLIEVDGGFSKIAEEIKAGNPRDIAKIRKILHVQAHGTFRFSDGSTGNMLSLRVKDKHSNGEPSKLSMVLGEMLFAPYDSASSQRNNRLLIPIGDLPPLHGSKNSYASQAQLQLLVFREFSRQSKLLAKEGYVIISSDQWKELAFEAGVSTDSVEEIVHHWCQRDFFNCFLDRQRDEYRLASYYDKAQKFLEDQGRLRISNSERGKKSTEIQRKKRL